MTHYIDENKFHNQFTIFNVGMGLNNVLISRQKLYDMIKSSGCKTMYEQLNLIKKEI